MLGKVLQPEIGISHDLFKEAGEEGEEAEAADEVPE